MRDHYQEFRALGAEVLAIAMLRPELLTIYLTELNFPFPFVSDPEQLQYRRFGLTRARWSAYLRPRVLLGYISLILRGRRPRLPSGHEDVHQLGGDFVIDAHGQLTYAFRSASPTQRPSIAILREELAKAGGRMS